MTETPLSHQEKNIIALAYWVVNQGNLPDQMVERHGMIFDFYLESCPVQVYGIIELIKNLNEGEWIDD